MTYTKYMCICSINIGMNGSDARRYPKCGNMMKQKLMIDGHDDKEWESITLDMCER